jgi:hypothetical protein
MGKGRLLIKRYVPRLIVSCLGGRTKAAAVGECDINEIIRRAKASGALPPLSRPGVYQDVSSVPDTHSALSLIKRTPPRAIRAALAADKPPVPPVAVMPPVAAVVTPVVKGGEGK